LVEFSNLESDFAEISTGLVVFSNLGLEESGSMTSVLFEFCCLTSDLLEFSSSVSIMVEFFGMSSVFSSVLLFIFAELLELLSWASRLIS